jgi:DNA mismatch repair ATPase MutS
MLQSFASFVNQSGGEYTSPKIGAGLPLALRQSRHPMLERLGDASVVPNDVAMGLTTNFQIVSGPNMAGKSTYLRQTALICLMAHVGCHVPAEVATMPLLKRIFTRIGSADSLETNDSSFSVEMRETNYILRNLGPSALVLVSSSVAWTWRYNVVGPIGRNSSCEVPLRPKWCGISGR